MSNARYLSILNEIKKKGGSVDFQDTNKKVLIVDGLNTFIRVFSVMPTLNVSTTAYIVGIANQTFNTARTSNGATIINGATGTVASPPPAAPPPTRRAWGFRVRCSARHSLHTLVGW